MNPLQPTHRAEKLRKYLETAYPEVVTQLRHNSPFELLVATILSAQCTDRQVNTVTEILFRELVTPEDFAAVCSDRLEELIRPTGYYKNKARNIQACAKTLVENFGGRVPDTLDALVSLPGVGRKTANVVLGAAFGIPGIVVDTHVARISKRVGLTRHADPVKIEFDLMEIIPKSQWNDFSLRLIYFGREICIARKPRCGICGAYDFCAYPDKPS
jgi:endonuclease-3